MFVCVLHDFVGMAECVQFATYKMFMLFLPHRSFANCCCSLHNRFFIFRRFIHKIYMLWIHSRKCRAKKTNCKLNERSFNASVCVQQVWKRKMLKSYACVAAVVYICGIRHAWPQRRCDKKQYALCRGKLQRSLQRIFSNAIKIEWIRFYI